MKQQARDSIHLEGSNPFSFYCWPPPETAETRKMMYCTNPPACREPSPLRREHTGR